MLGVMSFASACGTSVYRTALYSQHSGQHIPYTEDDVSPQAQGPAPLTHAKTPTHYRADLTLGIAP